MTKKQSTEEQKIRDAWQRHIENEAKYLSEAEIPENYMSVAELDEQYRKLMQRVEQFEQQRETSTQDEQTNIAQKPETSRYQYWLQASLDKINEWREILDPPQKLAMGYRRGSGQEKNSEITRQAPILGLNPEITWVPIKFWQEEDGYDMLLIYQGQTPKAQLICPEITVQLDGSPINIDIHDQLLSQGKLRLQIHSKASLTEAVCEIGYAADGSKDSILIRFSLNR